jgi:hypothetical protein
MRRRGSWFVAALVIAAMFATAGACNARAVGPADPRDAADPPSCGPNDTTPVSLAREDGTTGIIDSVDWSITASCRLSDGNRLTRRADIRQTNRGGSPRQGDLQISGSFVLPLNERASLASNPEFQLIFDQFSGRANWCISGVARFRQTVGGPILPDVIFGSWTQQADTTGRGGNVLFGPRLSFHASGSNYEVVRNANFMDGCH